ncbi:hypothetical protein BC830DRAFT_1086809 [Chytriomyces sp. MP71]|nr:hypothetical protein BC830DRAFT_1086809 [Chytriomyces sp. MP71]
MGINSPNLQNLQERLLQGPTKSIIHLFSTAGVDHENQNQQFILTNCIPIEENTRIAVQLSDLRVVFDQIKTLVADFEMQLAAAEMETNLQQKALQDMQYALHPVEIPEYRLLKYYAHIKQPSLMVPIDLGHSDNISHAVPTCLIVGFLMEMKMWLECLVEPNRCLANKEADQELYATERITKEKTNNIPEQLQQQVIELDDVGIDQELRGCQIVLC